MPNDSTRRNFLLTSLAAVGGALGLNACQSGKQFQAASPAINPGATIAYQTKDAAASAPMPERPLGQTGIALPLLGLGGSASPLSRSRDSEAALAIIQRALELGVRYFDTAANYGPSEAYLGQVLPSHRDSIFLATKTSRRDRDGAWRQLEQSLQRLQTDVIDLWQFHALTHDWDLDSILDPQQGAIKAAQEAQAQRLIRHVGVTGHHNPAIIAQALQRYPFDTALIPVNAADKHTSEPFITHVLPLAQTQNVGIIAMKVPAYGRLFKSGALSGMGEAMGYALSQAGVHCCIIAAETVAQLEENVRAAREYQPLSASAIASIEQRTQSVWQENSFFRNWG